MNIAHGKILVNKKPILNQNFWAWFHFCSVIIQIDKGTSKKIRNLIKHTKNTNFSAYIQYRICCNTESAIQISSIKKFQHTFSIQKIQNLLQISTAIQKIQHPKIHSAYKFLLQYRIYNTFSIQKNFCNTNFCCIENFCNTNFCCKNKFLLHWKFSTALNKTQ